MTSGGCNAVFNQRNLHLHCDRHNLRGVAVTGPVSIEDAQAEIGGLLVAEILMDFQSNFQGVYPDYILARGVGPEQSMIGLAIRRGHLSRASARPVTVELLERVERAFSHWKDGYSADSARECLYEIRAAIAAMKEMK